MQVNVMPLNKLIEHRFGFTISQRVEHIVIYLFPFVK